MQEVGYHRHCLLPPGQGVVLMHSAWRAWHACSSQHLIACVLQASGGLLLLPLLQVEGVGEEESMPPKTEAALRKGFRRQTLAGPPWLEAVAAKVGGGVGASCYAAAVRLVCQQWPASTASCACLSHFEHHSFSIAKHRIVLLRVGACDQQRQEDHDWQEQHPAHSNSAAQLAADCGLC